MDNTPNGRSAQSFSQQATLIELVRLLVIFVVILWAMSSSGGRIRTLETSVNSHRSRLNNLEKAVLGKSKDK